MSFAVILYIFGLLFYFDVHLTCNKCTYGLEIVSLFDVLSTF